MGFRFRKTVSLGKLVRLNISKSGIGVSTGVRGLRLSVSPDGKVRSTVGLPGTGLSHTKDIGDLTPSQAGAAKSKQQRQCQACGKRASATDRFCRHCGARLVAPGQ